MYSFGVNLVSCCHSPQAWELTSQDMGAGAFPSNAEEKYWVASANISQEQAEIVLKFKQAELFDFVPPNAWRL